MRFLMISLLLLFGLTQTASADWFGSSAQKVDFTPEELDSLEKEFHDAYDLDLAPLGGKFELTFFKSIFSYLSLATIKEGVPTIAIMGGNLSYKTMDMDSLRLLICHEMGHFMGGGPRRIELDPMEDQTWNVIEGASDYFATTQCMKRVLQGQNHTRVLMPQTVDSKIVADCQESFGEFNDRLLCVRSMLASQKLIAYFASVKGVENIYRFDTPDQSVVETTFVSHPDLQCRLDTFRAGALCNVDASEVMDPKDLSKGTCSDRPACWFSSQK